MAVNPWRTFARNNPKCWFVAAGNTIQSGNHFLRLHTSYQGTNALGIAITTADKLRILYNSILIYTDADVLGAGTMSLISHLGKMLYILVVDHRKLIQRQQEFLASCWYRQSEHRQTPPTSQPSCR